MYSGITQCEQGDWNRSTVVPSNLPNSAILWQMLLENLFSTLGGKSRNQPLSTLNQGCHDMITRQGQDSQTAWYCQDLRKQHHSSGAGLSAVSALTLVWYPRLPVATEGMHHQVTVGDPHFHATFQVSNATVREAPSLWSLCFPERRLGTCAALIYTLRQDFSTFYSSLRQVGSWVATRKMLAPQ